MKSWTISEMLSERPCAEYRDKVKLDALWAGRERLTLVDVLRLDIPARDRIWVAIRPKAISSEMRKEWREGIVARAIKRACEVYTDEAYHAWAEKWLRGEDRSRGADAAAADAYAAAAYAAAAAAYAAADADAAAAYAAADADAAYAAAAAAAAADAAAAAADAAAAAAADAADAYAAEREQQVVDLITLLEDEG